MAYATKSGYYYLQQSAIQSVDEKCGLMEVGPHPQGGFTIWCGSEGTTMRTADGNWGSREAAAQALATRKASMLKSYMHERTAAAVRQDGPEQLPLFG